MTTLSLLPPTHADLETLDRVRRHAGTLRWGGAERMSIPAARRSGVATALISESMRRLAYRRVTTVRLVVESENQSGLRGRRQNQRRVVVRSHHACPS